MHYLKTQADSLMGQLTENDLKKLVLIQLLKKPQHFKKVSSLINKQRDLSIIKVTESEATDD